MSTPRKKRRVPKNNQPLLRARTTHELLDEAERAAKALGMSVSDIVRIGVRRAVREFKETGTISKI